MTITKRLTKGSPLTHAELDANFQYLLDNKANKDLSNVLSLPDSIVELLRGQKGDTGQPGAAGNTGASGANGLNGATWRSGQAAPTSSLGANGDYYLNTTTYDVYLKSSNTYYVICNIKGADGNSSSSGGVSVESGEWTPYFAVGVQGAPLSGTILPSYWTSNKYDYSATYTKIGSLVLVSLRSFCSFSNSTNWSSFAELNSNSQLWIGGIPFAPSDGESAAFAYNWATPAGFCLISGNLASIRKSNSSMLTYSEQNGNLLIFNAVYRTNG